MEVAINYWEELKIHFGREAAISIIFTVAIAFTTIIYYLIKTRKDLPGPTGIPFFGLWPLLRESDAYLTLSNLQKKYSDMYSFKYAGTLYIHAGSIKAIKELHITRSDCFERYNDYGYLKIILEKGLLVLNGEAWKSLRKFSLLQFKELGMTSMKEESNTGISDSLRETVEELKSIKGEPVKLIQLITTKCNAVMYRTLFGESGVTEQEIGEFTEAYSVVTDVFFTGTNLLLSGNFAEYFIFPIKLRSTNFSKRNQLMRKKFMAIVQSCKSNFNEDHPRNFIDAYYREKNIRRSRGDPSSEYFTDEALVSTLVQIVGDGILGVAFLICVFIKHLTCHPEYQEKIFAELMEVVGKQRMPVMEDKSKLPYTNAVIWEIQRFYDFFPMFPSQQCVKETTVRGYKIPKGAVTLVNFHACHHDPNVYENPETFNPERFLVEAGKKRPELPIPFGVGKRACIGENYTMMQVFLFMTAIIQNFKLTAAEKDANVDLTDIFSGKMQIRALPRD